MESLNAPHETAFKDFLHRTVADAKRHARFLNMLSMLEHMGSRKIMISQMKGILTQEILKHLAEETRHAFFFKRQAERMAGGEINGYPAADTLCRAPAQMYFGRLDAQISHALPADTHPETAYLWVSMIVELRACWVYHIYQEVLQNAGAPFSIKSIIAEENLHLADMYDRLDEIGAAPEKDIARFAQMETALFEKFLTHLLAATPQDAQNAA